MSFYQRARGDSRFLEVLAVLESKLVEGQIIVDRINPKLAKFAFCTKGQPSELATLRYREIQENLKPS